VNSPTASRLSGSAHAVQKLSQVNGEAPREAHEHPHTWIALAAFDAADVGQGEAASVGDLLLREPAFGADSADISAEAVEGVACHGGIVVA
jgi:hypothetical protein